MISMYIPVTLRDKKGRVVKKFDVNGALSLEDVALFIWRDMMLSILARGTSHQRDMIPRMLADIYSIMGWRPLVRLLSDQPRGILMSHLIHTAPLLTPIPLLASTRRRNHDHESEWEDVEDDDDDEASLPDLDSQSETSDSTITDNDFDLGLLRQSHWSDIIYEQVDVLRRHIEAAMITIFEVSPSSDLYNSLLSLSDDPQQLDRQLLATLKTMATSSSETYAVALEIYSQEHRINDVVDLLDSHSHLLRPRDCAALQTAANLLSHHGHKDRALEILEAELIDVLQTTRHALLQSFSQMEEPAHRTELTQILRMTRGSAGRRGRVEAWVDAVTTPGADAPNPMMFAALFMGMQGVPGMNNDDDQYTYLDIDPHDPDLEDLRAEFRPNLKKRFESWTDVALVMNGGPAMLLAVYRKVIEVLPFLRVSDVAEEMMARCVRFLAVSMRV